MDEDGRGLVAGLESDVNFLRHINEASFERIDSAIVDLTGLHGAPALIVVGSEGVDPAVLLHDLAREALRAGMSVRYRSGRDHSSRVRTTICLTQREVSRLELEPQGAPWHSSLTERRGAMERWRLTAYGAEHDLANDPDPSEPASRPVQLDIVEDHPALTLHGRREPVELTPVGLFAASAGGPHVTVVSTDWRHDCRDRWAGYATIVDLVRSPTGEVILHRGHEAVVVPQAPSAHTEHPPRRTLEL